MEVNVATFEERALIEGLMQPYAREFSRWCEVQFNADGTFTYPLLGTYWSEPNRFPFLFRVNGEVAGFALVRKTDCGFADGEVCDVAEFFVAEAFRRQGAGSAAACAVWGRLPGRWQVRVLEANETAMRFWDSAVREFTGITVPAVSVHTDGKAWRAYVFNAGPDGQAGTG